MSSPSIVRRALPEDEPSIWKLFYELHAENGAFPLSVPKVQYLLNRVLYPGRIAPGDMGPRGYMGVIGPTNNIEGFILMLIGSYWYSDMFVLEELANFVSKDHRKGTKHAETLLKYAKHLSDKLDVPLLIGIVSTIKTEAKVRLYKRHFPLLGAFFLHNKQMPHTTNGKAA